MSGPGYVQLTLDFAPRTPSTDGALDAIAVVPAKDQLKRSVTAGPERLLRRLVASGLERDAIPMAAALIMALNEQRAIGDWNDSEPRMAVAA